MKRGILATAILFCMFPALLFAASSNGSTLAGKAGAIAQSKIQANGSAGDSQPQSITPGPVPADLIVTENGLDWVWGSPCNGGCSSPDPANQEGWRHATWDELLAAPSCDAFLNPDNSVKCASQYFDPNYTICNLSDCRAGWVSSINGPEQACINGNYDGNCESWYVRGESSVESTAARFYVTKTFEDGATDEVEVTLTCNGGLPLTQSFTIAGGDDGVTFTVRDFVDGTDCEVTETSGPDGYTPSYNGGPDACTFTDISMTVYNCDITNEPADATLTVNSEWVIQGPATNEIVPSIDVQVRCSVDFDGASHDGLFYSDFTLSGETASVKVTGIGTHLPDNDNWCYVIQTNDEVSSVESTNGCGTPSDPIVLTRGEEADCTITSTAFFEGIPTLSHYGMAFMALLMLGFGFVGLRRIV